MGSMGELAVKQMARQGVRVVVVERSESVASGKTPRLACCESRRLESRMPIDPQELEHLLEERGGSAPPFCVSCGYNLTGAVSSRCPECGCRFVGAEWRDKVEEINRRLCEARRAHEWGRPALGIAAASVAMMALANSLGGSGVAMLLRISALMGGVTGTFLGLGVFRVGRLPDWALAQLKEPPRYATAIGTIALGLLAVGLAIVVG